MSVRLDSILPPGWLDLFSSDPQIGIGLDPATTTKETSNPSAITVTQKVGLMHYARLVLRFKTDDPDVTEGLLRAILLGLRGRGLSVRRLVILATNERFFAVSMRKKFVRLVPVELVIESEKTIYLGEPMLYKAYLGNLFVNTIDDGYLALPPESWISKDVRLVVRDRGTFQSELSEDGGHADTFDSTKASLHAVKGKGQATAAAGVPVGTFNRTRPSTAGRKLVNPVSRRAGGRVLT